MSKVVFVEAMNMIGETQIRTTLKRSEKSTNTAGFKTSKEREGDEVTCRSHHWLGGWL